MATVRDGGAVLAFGDESVRVSHTPPLYLLAATVLPSGSDADALALRGILPKGARKLHWRDMANALQRRSLSRIGAIAGIDIEHVPGDEDERLWIPGQILGAYGDVASETGHFRKWLGSWEPVSGNVEVIEISL